MPVKEGEEQAEQRVDADRPENRAEADLVCLGTRHEEVDEELRRACLGALQELGSGGRLRPGLDLELEAERLHGLLDGLALHTAMRPDRMSPRLIRSVLARHLDSLDLEVDGH